MTKLTALIRLGGKTPLNETQTFGLMTLTVSFGAVCYIAYMARLFFFPEVDTYSIYEDLAIAAFAFTDLIWAIVSLAKARKQANLVLIGLKCGSLSNGLSAIVLAQIASLSLHQSGGGLFF
jgi:ABC-type Fe3+-siderophore transport system permease subunit